MIPAAPQIRGAGPPTGAVDVARSHRRFMAALLYFPNCTDPRRRVRPAYLLFICRPHPNCATEARWPAIRPLPLPSTASPHPSRRPNWPQRADERRDWRHDQTLRTVARAKMEGYTDAEIAERQDALLRTMSGRCSAVARSGRRRHPNERRHRDRQFPQGNRTSAR